MHGSSRDGNTAHQPSSASHSLQIRTRACRRPLREFLDGYKHEAALSVHWVWVGPNGRATRPAAGGVLPHYTRCSAQAAPQIKTIANLYFLEGLAVHPHNFHYQYGPRMLCCACVCGCWAPGVLASHCLRRRPSGAACLRHTRMPACPQRGARTAAACVACAQGRPARRRRESRADPTHVERHAGVESARRLRR